MVVVPGPEAGFDPTVLAIERDRGGVRLGNLEENNPVSPLRDGSQQSGSDAAPSPGRIDGQIQDFRLVGSALAPGTESGGLGVDQGHEERKSCVIAQRPLGSFGTMVLDAGDCVEIAFGPWPDQNGISCAGQTSIVTRTVVTAPVCPLCRRTGGARRPPAFPTGTTLFKSPSSCARPYRLKPVPTWAYARYGSVFAKSCTQFREPGASERPASGCTTPPPQTATPVRISACRKLFNMA